MSGTKGQVENLLSEIGKKIDHLVKETKEATGDVREEVEKRIDDLKQRKDKLEKEFQELRNQEKWQEAKEHFGVAAQELKKAVEAIFSKERI